MSVRARDLRPGDVVAPDYRVLSVQEHGAVLMVVTQRPGHAACLGVALADQWMRLVQEGP